MDGAEEVYGKLTVTLKRLSSYGDIIERRLEVADSEGTSPHRIVTLLQLSSWPLEEVPHPSAILSLVDLLSKAQRSSPSRHTIVMCRYMNNILWIDKVDDTILTFYSDGVGRTGTFICLHSQLERLKTEGVVDFFQGVKSARIQRAGLVPDAVR